MKWKWFSRFWTEKMILSNAYDKAASSARNFTLGIKEYETQRELIKIHFDELQYHVAQSDKYYYSERFLSDFYKYTLLSTFLELIMFKFQAANT